MWIVFAAVKRPGQTLEAVPGEPDIGISNAGRCIAFPCREDRNAKGKGREEVSENGR